MSNASDTGDQPGATTHFGFRDVPEGVKVTLKGRKITATGKRGTLTRVYPSGEKSVVAASTRRSLAAQRKKRKPAAAGTGRGSPSSDRAADPLTVQLKPTRLHKIHKIAIAQERGSWRTP